MNRNSRANYTKTLQLGKRHDKIDECESRDREEEGKWRWEAKCEAVCVCARMWPSNLFYVLSYISFFGTHSWKSVWRGLSRAQSHERVRWTWTWKLAVTNWIRRYFEISLSTDALHCALGSRMQLLATLTSLYIQVKLTVGDYMRLSFGWIDNYFLNDSFTWILTILL